MRVLIVGSLTGVPEARRDDFIHGCHQIGLALARAGAEFVVSTFHSDTADRHVTEGASEARGTHNIWVLHPEDDPTPKPPLSDSHKGRFRIFYRRLRGSWAAGIVSQVQAADCVLVIGGGRGSVNVSYAAIALERPVLAVGSFGGAGAELHKEFVHYYQRLGALSHVVGDLREDWQEHYADFVVRGLLAMIRKRVFRKDSASALSPLLFTLVLFVSWVWLFVAPPRPWQASFFTILAISAFLGSALRSSMGELVEPFSSPRTWREVAVEMRAGLVLAFAMALLYLAGSFTFTGGFDVVSADSSLDDYQRVAIAMGLVGIAGGWLLERVAKSLTAWFGSRMPGGVNNT